MGTLRYRTDARSRNGRPGQAVGVGDDLRDRTIPSELPGAPVTHPSDPSAPAAQPPTPEGAWTPPQGGAPVAPYAEPQKSGGKKWLAIGGGVLVAGVAGLSLLGVFGAGDPEVGDCVRMTSDTDFEAVDCSADDAEFKVVGIHDEELTWPDFEEAVTVDEVCQEFATWEVALWIGDLETEPGAIYCSEPV
jgi:hypothetical protein